MSVAFKYDDNKLSMRVVKDDKIYEQDITNQIEGLPGTLDEKLEILMDLDFDIGCDEKGIHASARWNNLIMIHIYFQSFLNEIKELKVEKQLEAKNKCIGHIKQMIRDCINQNPYRSIIINYDDIFLKEMHQDIKDYFRNENIIVTDFIPSSPYGNGGIKLNL